MNVFEISGYLSVALIMTAAIIPGVAVPALFFTPIALCVWMVGQCLPEEETNNEVTLKK